MFWKTKNKDIDTSISNRYDKKIKELESKVESLMSNSEITKTITLSEFRENEERISRIERNIEQLNRFIEHLTLENAYLGNISIKHETHYYTGSFPKNIFDIERFENFIQSEIDIKTEELNKLKSQKFIVDCKE